MTEAEREAKMEATPWLHLRSQMTNHAEANIVGTPAGLRSLLVAIEAALADGSSSADAFASDGEGYEVKVRRTRTVSGLGRTTYIDDEARHLANYEREYLVRESKLMRKQQKEALDALRWCRANANPHLPHPRKEVI